MYPSKFKKLSQLEEKLYNGDKLNGYRLGDLILHPIYLTRNHEFSSIRESIYKYPDTIAVKYLKEKYPFLQKINSEDDFERYDKLYNDFEIYISENKDTKPDIQLLNKIIKDNGFTESIFESNTLVLHIRVGDILCNYNNDTRNNYSKKGNKVWWSKVLNYIKSNHITNVIIVSGTHFTDCLEESVKYLENRKHLINKLGIEVKYHLGYSPDEDFVFCKNAKHFITTGGGYGNFIGEMVKLNGGNFALM